MKLFFFFWFSAKKMQKFWNFSSSKLQFLTDFWNEFSFFDPKRQIFEIFSVFHWKFKFFEKINLEIWIVCSTFDKFLENLNFFPEKLANFEQNSTFFRAKNSIYDNFWQIFQFSISRRKIDITRAKIQKFWQFLSNFQAPILKNFKSFTKSIHYYRAKNSFFDDFWERFLCNFQTKKWHF